MGSAPERRTLMLESLLDAASLGIVALDCEQRVVLWNRWMAEHANLPAQHVLGKPFFSVFDKLENARLEEAVRQALRGFPSVLSQTLHKAPLPLFARPGGRRIQQAVAVTPVELEGASRHCLIQVSDVTAAVTREQLLREQALELRTQTFSDGLTGVYNRRYFDQAIEKEVRRAKRSSMPLSLLMIDIDFFKSYNDHYGHQLGDDTLLKVAGTLSDCLLRKDDLVARYGGEEFAVVLPETGKAQALQMAETLRARVALLNVPHAYADAKPYVTVSIGLATRRGEGTLEAAALIRAADRALYEAKHAGRDRVIALTSE
ncbi:MAG TPA: diguanylate cyclase [Telluria sp.]